MTNIEISVVTFYCVCSSGKILQWNTEEFNALSELLR
jgi:hypothetical protein